MTDVTISQDVPLDRDTAFRAFTDAAVLRTWWWPHLPDTTYVVDPVPGGKIEISSAAAGIGFGGTFTSLDAPAELAFTWTWKGDDGVDPVRVTFTPSADSTQVTVTHTCSADSAASLVQGWRDVLNRLSA